MAKVLDENMSDENLDTIHAALLRGAALAQSSSMIKASMLAGAEALEARAGAKGLPRWVFDKSLERYVWRTK
jgi:hypothetical protein